MSNPPPPRHLISEVKSKYIGAYWKVHTPNLLGEIMHNDSAWILKHPLRIFGSILEKIAHRTAEIKDPELMSLCARLTLFEISDPHSKEYNAEINSQIINKTYNF